MKILHMNVNHKYLKQGFANLILKKEGTGSVIIDFDIEVSYFVGGLRFHIRLNRK